jgi:hypothetical protein
VLAYEERLKPIGIVEALPETEHWLGWTKHFGPGSGFESKLENVRLRHTRREALDLEKGDNYA